MDRLQPFVQNSPAPDSAHHIRRISTLWIDDQPAVVDSCRERLRRSGIDVMAAADGAYGLQLARARIFDLIILDENLGRGANGLQVLAELRAHDRRTPVMMLTAYGTPDSAFEARGLGAVKYAAKPMTGQELVDAIHDALVQRFDATAPARVVNSNGQQTTWRPAPDELSFLQQLAERWGVSRNHALRRLVRAAMKQDLR